MYLVAKEMPIIEGTVTELFGISDNNGILITFTDDPVEAENFVRLCNENQVEPNHIVDVVEDSFYS